MQGLSKQQALEDLRAKIERIEKRPVGLGEGERSPSAEDFALPPGVLHEVFTDAQRNAGALLGFALAAARALISQERPAVLYLQLIGETSDTGLPYAPGLAAFGIDPQSVVLVRAQTITELLWAAEEGLACGAVAGVIADISSDPKAVDFTAGRRLGLRAAESGGTMFLLRYGLQRHVSAARLRWKLTPALSGQRPFDPKAPGESRWRLSLEKGVWRGKPNSEWFLGWTENGFAILDIPDGNRVPATAPLPRPLSAALGDRLAKTA